MYTKKTDIYPNCDDANCESLAIVALILKPHQQLHGLFKLDDGIMYFCGEHFVMYCRDYVIQYNRLQKI